jgi:hypothetical protein
MFEILCVTIFPVMLLAFWLIQLLIVHRSPREVNGMLKEMVLEAMAKHDRDFSDE